MEVSQEQAQEIKKQLIEQIQNTFPEDKKQESIEKINSMDHPQLIEFLKQNGMIKDSDSDSSNNESSNTEQQCIFCSIISNQIPSTKISEDQNSTAILELNPLSEGHTLAIPKKHQEEIPEETKKFAEQIRQKLKDSLNPKEVLIEPGTLFGHGVLNIIPLYGDSIPTEKQKSSPEELQKVKEKIESSKSKEQTSSEEQTQPTTESEEEIKIIPRRIP